MKLHQSRILLCSALGCALATNRTAQAGRARLVPPPPAGPAPVGVYTTLSGTVSQFNYDREAEVEGFLLSNNTLVRLPPRAAARIATSVTRGDNVQINGFAQTSPAGLQTIEAQSVEDRSSGKTITVPQPGRAAPYSGSGRIQQLNYGPDGSVNGFVVDNGTLARVAPFAATNPSSIRIGVTVAYSGYARNTVSGRTVVDVQNLTLNGQVLNLPTAERSGPPAPPPPAVRPSDRMNPSVAPQPAGRTAEPPTPPSPPQTPHN